MMRGAVLLAALLLACGTAAAQPASQPDIQPGAQPAAQPGTCPDIAAPPIPLPRLRDAVLANNEVTVVSLGSSSTQGVRSSDIAHSYPALLQADLAAALPNAHVAVLNRGIGGEDVTEELARLERDVVGVHPAVVVWQVGANGAMRHMHVDLFARLLVNGIKRLQQAHIDVVLMDNQRARNVMSTPEATPIEHVMADIAKSTGVELFARGVLMDRWRDAGYPYDRFMSDDGVHHNDLGYRCVAGSLARAMLDGLKELMPGPGSRPSTLSAGR